jgi:hypothetical protein
MWLRYDQASQKVFRRVLDTSVVYMDFNVPAGQQFAQYDPVNGSTSYRTVYESNVNLFGNVHQRKGFIMPYNNTIMREWISDIGVVPFQTNTYFKIVQSLQLNNQDTSYITDGGHPSFSVFTPILETSTLDFNFDFRVYHTYNYYYSVFFKNIYADCFYKSNSDSISAGRLIAYYTSDGINSRLIFHLSSELLNNGYSFYYKVTAIDWSLIPIVISKPDSGYYKLVYTPTFVEEENGIPTEFSLSQNYPNPFNPSTNIQYSISSRQFVTLKVFDVLGKEVATLVNEDREVGNYNVEFTMNNVQLSSGIYFYQLKADTFVETKKMILLK